ncbi:MAG: glutamyl-tRNA reductase, partial [Bacteroidota bacterium]
MTDKNLESRPLHSEKLDFSLIPLHVIAFTHKSTPLAELNRYFVPVEERNERLSHLREVMRLDEILYIATCNRIEFVFVTDKVCDYDFLHRFLHHFMPQWTEAQLQQGARHALIFDGDQALDHLFRVASSLDSLVVGEREIITQVRKSYDQCKLAGLTGDLIRLVVQSTINTAKRVYTETRIAANPVSVVSLAERQLRTLHLPKESRVLIVGAGETNTNLCKYLTKQGFRRFVIFNRTLDNAQALAELLRTEGAFADAMSLDALITYKGGFDLLVTCTGSAHAIIDAETYHALLLEEKDRKVLIDLAMPADISPQVVQQNNAVLISIEALKEIAEKNLVQRQAELTNAERIVSEQIIDFERIFKTRSLEIRMREVPDQVRAIRERAMNDVFATEIGALDEKSKEVLEKVITYMEKKYISVP